jgi:hypothetical protein
MSCFVRKGLPVIGTQEELLLVVKQHQTVVQRYSSK